MDRIINIRAASGFYNRGTPILQLQGSYLTQHGFKVGESVTFHLEQGQITITLKKETK